MLYDKLKSYKEIGIYPFHMPGHKRNDISSDGLLPYEIDLTEIDGFDNLHNACGCIREVEKKAEKLYDVDPKTLDLASDTKRIQDLKGNHLLLFTSYWSIDWALEHNKGLKLREFGTN